MIYYSLQSLSSILIDTLNFYFLPFISMYSFICNILMVIVFTNKRLNGDVYQYLLFDSLVGTFYFSISTFIFLIRCGVYCPYGYDYTSKFYELYLYFFIGKTVEVISFLIPPFWMSGNVSYTKVTLLLAQKFPRIMPMW